MGPFAFAGLATVSYTVLPGDTCREALMWVHLHLHLSH